ncbi:MAG: prepilin peptidase [Bacillus sp. (in: firmicutes)]
MDVFIVVYLAVIGLIFGSFFNVVGLRVPLGQSIVRPRSACPGCHHELTASELIPVFSYFLQKGKCRNCAQAISPIYPAIELITALLFISAPFLVGWNNHLFIAYSLISLLVIITVSDLAYMIIPNKVLLFFLVWFVVLHFFIGDLHLMNALLGMLIGFAVLLLIALLSNGGMGGGDVKLLAVLGVALGVKLVMLSLFFAILYGAAAGLLFMAIGLMKKRQPIPFGPFLALGALTSYFYGEQIVNWYFGVIL